MQMWEYVSSGGISVETGWFLSRPDDHTSLFSATLSHLQKTRILMNQQFSVGYPWYAKHEIKLPRWTAGQHYILFVFGSSPVAGETEIGRFVLKDG